jgi:DNA-binding response OmpR family regulator
MTTSNTNPNRKLKILLVDDDADTRDLVSMIVQNAGHQLISTGQGRQALSLLEREAVDVILLDIMMPDVDGLSVLETIRKYSLAPVIMLTALSEGVIMEQSYQLGADDYIVKPFAMTKLIERIDRIIDKLPYGSTEGINDMVQDYELELENNLLHHGGKQIELTPNETRMLNRLLNSAYNEVGIVQLYEAVWGHDPLPQRSMRTLVSNTLQGLRLKIESDPYQPRIFLQSDSGCTFIPL